MYSQKLLDILTVSGARLDCFIVYSVRRKL